MDRRPPKKVAARAWSLEETVDGLGFAIAGVLVVWLGWLLVTKSPALSWEQVVYLIVFWALVAYVGLPRLEQVLAKIFVPDYFVGRTVTTSGILGDPVNLAADGSEAQVHAAMTRAGWTRADEVTLRSSWGIIVSAVFRRSYPEAPVSPLFVFGRHQAFAYEQEVAGNASQRHHVRFWPTPEDWVLPGGRRVDWLAAGTYDRAVGLSLFTLQVTHKIDADIDAERDHVVGTICVGDRAASVTVVEKLFSPFHTRNGGGDAVHTDGDFPVVDLTTVAPLAAAAASAAPAIPTVRGRRLPPLMLLVAGVLSAGKAMVTLVGLVLLAAGVHRTDLAPDSTTAQLIELGAVAAISVALWALTLTRRRWARTLLMAVSTADALSQLASLSRMRGDHASVVVLVTAGISVLILITVSSDDARRWVAPPAQPVATP